jgi:hypothetical protein
MNALAHVATTDVPLWLAVLAAGIGLGIALTLAVLGRATWKR